MSEKSPLHTKKAVALKYPEGAEAPFITASAKGLLAEELLKCAKMNDIMIVEDGGLTDFLSVQEIGTIVPEEAWEAIALIFSFITLQDKSHI
ncbi:MAG: EscU/YscU/HrcU family type III secretion system export apparatus switch protein [Treponema sp.]|nr:EscU/YscU/HrcU family type III secretion system export apparatus switch protein [Treponema sp.]